VVENFDPTKDYGTHVRKAIAKCLGSLKKGQKIIPKEFVQENLNKFNKGDATIVSNKSNLNKC